MAWVWIATKGGLDRPSAQEATRPSPARNGLRAALQRNFDLATRGADPQQSRMTVIPRDNSAGLLCNPAALDRNGSKLRILLPPFPEDRKGVLAALTPDGSLRIIYESYGADTDPEDLVIPSKAIDWMRARTRGEFIVDVGQFDALRPGRDVPEALFGQPGLYQFALLNGDRELLDAAGEPFWVIAGCVVRYQP